MPKVEGEPKPKFSIKITNTIAWEQKWHKNFSGPPSFWVIGQNIVLMDNSKTPLQGA